MPDIDKLLNVIDAYEGEAYGSDTDGGELSRQRSLALRGFAGENIEPQPEGRSQVVDFTVFETVQKILPSLTRIFASGDDIVELDPFGPEDEDAAKQESQYLNHLVVAKTNWFQVFLTWAQDALITKNAYCMAFMDKRHRTEVESYKAQSEDQVTMILDDDVEVVSSKTYPDPDFEPGPLLTEQGEPQIDMETGEIALEEIPNLFDLDVRRTTAKEVLAYRVLPPEHCLVDGNCTDPTLDNCDYFEFWDNVSLSELRRMGYEIEDDVGESADNDTLEDNARDSQLETQGFRDSNGNPDKSTRRVKARWIWVAHDYDEDGIAELNHVLRVGQDILVMEGDDNEGINQVSSIPVASIVPYINTHRHIGNSIADLVFDIQRIKTAILRQGLDSLYFANNPRPIASNKVVMDDLLVHQAGSPIRVDSDVGDVGNHVIPYTLPFIFPQAQEGLRHMDTVVESRVGVNNIFQGIDESSSNDHNRIGQLSTMAAQRVEQIARIMGNGVQRLFKISHELIIKSGHKSESIKLTGKWVDFDPTQWKTGRDMRVVAPFAAGNKDSLIQRLMLIKGIHSEAAAAGHPMVQADDSYALAQEISRAADLPDYKFFTDPTTVPPPEPPVDYTMLALELESQKVNNAAENDAREAELEKMKLSLDAENQKREDELNKYKADLDAEVRLIIAGGKDEGMIRLEQARARLKNEPTIKMNSAVESSAATLEATAKSLQSATESLREISDNANAPIKIVRKDGKIVGKEVNGKFIEVN